MKGCIAIVIALAGSPAFGDPPQDIPPKARLLANKGRAAHEKHDYARAIAAFKEAYVMAPAPELLFNLAQAYRLQGTCDDAAMMYRRFLGSNPAPEERVLAEAHLATVERCVHQRSLGIPMDASMAYLAVPPPPTDLSVFDSPSRSPSELGSRSSLKQGLGIGLGAGGVAALAVATYYGYEAHTASRQVEDAYAKGAKGKDVAAIAARGEQASSRAKVFGISGGAAVVAGVTLFVLGRHVEHAPPIAIAPTKSGAEVSYTWRF